MASERRLLLQADDIGYPTGRHAVSERGLTSTWRLWQASRPSIVRTPCPCRLRRVSRWPGLVAMAHADGFSVLSLGTAAGTLPPFVPGGMPKAGAEGCILNA